MGTVVVRLMGGLGNQLFQYAAGRSLAEYSAAKLFLDTSGFKNDLLRNYELDVFPIRASIAPEPVLLKFSSTGNSLAQRVKAIFRPPNLIYREQYYHYNKEIECLNPPVYLDGYWQSQRYFSGIASLLRKELTPSAPMESENQRMSHAINATNAVSLHIRRGDYVSNAHTNSYHGVCSIEYYRAAIDFLHSSVGEIHLFIFSDDHEWTKSNLQMNCPTTYVTANPPERGFRDMQLMAMCRHHIIANSSFSWWGAWLNPRPDKVVIAPKKWFANSENDTRDLIPDAWVRL